MALLTSRMGNAAIVERRNLWFLLSLVLILPGILLMPGAALRAIRCCP